MENRFIRILAGAGGGKTYELSKRYINLLKRHKGNLKRTLAITFTNKAASEMKERILSILKEDALNNGDTASEKLVDWILYNFSDFSVRTIDSFINKLVEVFSIDLGLSPQTELVLEAQYYKEYAVSKLIENVAEDETLKQTITNFILSMIELTGKTYWGFKDIIMKGMEEIENCEKDLAFPFDIPKESALETDRIMRNLRKETSVMAEELLKLSGENENINKRFLTKLEKGVKDINELLSSAYIKTECDNAIKKNATLNRDDFCHLFEQLKDTVFTYYTEKIFRNHNYHMHIYRNYKDILKNLKKEERVRFIEDINSELKILFDAFDVPFIYYRIGERYDHYLIDEFQDTSRSQWKNLKPLIENSLSEGGSFFFVGDPKQAIYQWRGGEVELFNEAFNSFSCVDEMDKRDSFTGMNFRSGFEIVNFNNEVFSNLPDNIKMEMGERVNFYSKENVIQKAYKEKNNLGGYVSLKKIEGDSGDKADLEENIKNELIKTVYEIKKRFSNEEITILTRTNKQAKSIVNWLSLECIPVISNESLYLRSDANVKGFLSLLKFLQHPIDNLAFFGFITSPFFRKEINKSFDDIKKWYEGIQKQNYLYELFRKDFPDIWDRFIQPFFVRVGFLPLYDLSSDVLKTFRIPLNFPESNPFLEGLLEFIHNLEKKSITSIELMMKEWENAEASLHPPSILLPENADAVKVMTIHSAKGLEFPVVIIPFLYFSVQERNKKIKEIVVEYKGIKRIAKLDNKNLLPENEPLLLKHIKREMEKRITDNTFEELNNLYVAMTRAEKELHIFIPDNTPKNCSKGWNQILKRFVERGDYHCGTLQEGEISKKHIEFLEMATVGKVSVDEIESRLILRKNNITSMINKKREEALKLGNIVHRVLYYIRDTNDMVNIKSIIDRSLNEIALPEERGVFKERVESTIKKIMSIGKTKEWFTPGLLVWREKEMADRDGNIHRFDRVVIGEDIITLIDYKTGDEPVSRYKKQLRTYRDILIDYFPHRIVESCIIQADTGEVIRIE
jgi:ATP-dependent exoDNAse (exonuclease V) beta subunit